jgi:hypothetical protein
MMIFNLSTQYFHQKSFHYFEAYLITKLTLGAGTQVDKHFKLCFVSFYCSAEPLPSCCVAMLTVLPKKFHRS